MGKQVSLVTKTAFYHLCWTHQLTPYLSWEDLAMIIHSTVTLRLDYYKARYAGLPLKPLWKLQVIQNAADQKSWSVHITLILWQLHWHPISFWCQFKVLVFTFKAWDALEPYLRNCFTQHNPPCLLWSSSWNSLKVPTLCQQRQGPSQ